MASPSFNTFKVLSPTFKDTYASKKLKPPKLAKPSKIPGVKIPKPSAPNQGGY
jgi:hypothetical protein